MRALLLLIPLLTLTFVPTAAAADPVACGPWAMGPDVMFRTCVAPLQKCRVYTEKWAGHDDSWAYTKTCYA